MSDLPQNSNVLVQYLVHRLIEENGGMMDEALFQLEICLINNKLKEKGIDIGLPTYWGGDYDAMIERGREVTCNCYDCRSRMKVIDTLKMWIVGLRHMVHSLRGCGNNG